VRAGTARHDDDFAERRAARGSFVLRWLRRRPRDSVAAAVAALAAIAILVNALFLQSGPHPAPIFANKPMRDAAPATGPAAALSPRARPGGASVEVAPNARPRTDLMADIQRELSRRGFYDGALDGVYGPKTDAAIRDFEQAAGLRPSTEPNVALLATLRASNVKARPAPVLRNDPIAQLLAADKRLIAVQRALADFGYGPVKPSGIYDAETKAAIERFERARRRPPTGQVSEQLMRDLSALTGRPLE
jgi:peptidoglycan hydrolase-like protein with peptidoglycan-binding domain